MEQLSIMNAPDKTHCLLADGRRLERARGAEPGRGCWPPAGGQGWHQAGILGAGPSSAPVADSCGSRDRFCCAQVLLMCQEGSVAGGSSLPLYQGPQIREGHVRAGGPARRWPPLPGPSLAPSLPVLLSGPSLWSLALPGLRPAQLTPHTVWSGVLEPFAQGGVQGQWLSRGFPYESWAPGAKATAQPRASHCSLSLSVSVCEMGKQSLRLLGQVVGRRAVPGSANRPGTKRLLGSIRVLS